MTTDPHDDPVRRAWEANAAFWDARMGEGNDFQNVLVWPATERLLALRPGERVLDVACGNGLTSRRMAALGAEVLGIDFCGPLIERARERTPQDLPIRYRVLDATDEAALRSLGTFDAVQCSMALFDMATIEPLLRAVAGMLRPGGRFVSSLLHPCFNNPSSVHTAELSAREDGSFETVYSVKISRYLASYEAGGAAIPGQPAPQRYFHRSLTAVLEAAFAAGLVLDGFEERAFSEGFETGSLLLSFSGRFHEIPPVVVLRLRRAG
ncbi:MAG: class I SAM-dependent methyltransferase [Pseudomonadota bacterium]